MSIHKSCARSNARSTGNPFDGRMRSALGKTVDAGLLGRYMRERAVSAQLHHTRSAHGALCRYDARRCQREREAVMQKDPVCGMQIDPNNAAGQSTYQAKTYYFCSPACKQKFDKNRSARGR